MPKEELVREDQRAIYYVWATAPDRWYVGIELKRERPRSGLVEYTDAQGQQIRAFVCRRGSKGISSGDVLGPYESREWAVKAVARVSQ